MNPIMCIDPGASSGGIAYMASDGRVHAIPMPATMTEQIDAIREIVAEVPTITAVIEKTGFHRPGNSAVATAKFARHCGHLEAALYTWGIPYTEVSPAVWMRALGTLPKDKADRKRAIKEIVARRFPHLTITLKTSDALGIYLWATQRK